MSLAEARVHAEEIGGEQRGLVAAGAGAKLDDRVAVVERIARDEQRRERALERRRWSASSRSTSRRGLGGHLGVVNRNELARLRELVLEFLAVGRQLDDRLEPAVLPAELRELRADRERPSGLASARSTSSARASAAADGRGAPEAQSRGRLPGELLAEALDATSGVDQRCLPVKNGWQAAQTSVWISAIVERVWNVLPQAHFTVAVAYSGWMSVFMERLRSLGRRAGEYTLSEAQKTSRQGLGPVCGTPVTPRVGTAD